MATPQELCAGLPDNEKGRELQLHIMNAEKAYDDMYEGRGSLSGYYSDMKESMADAIRVARELRLWKKASQLERILEHRKKVFRSQMS